MNGATIYAGMVAERYCPHCDTITVQVGERPAAWPLYESFGDHPEPGHCLQCIADGRRCCNLNDFCSVAV